MGDPKQPTPDARAPVTAGTLKDGLGRLADALLNVDDPKAAEEFEGLLTRMRELFRRKQNKEASRNETRDLIAELLFSRLRRALRTFQPTGDARDEIKVATWMMGALFGSQALAEFATAVDRAIIEAASPRDYSFAGLADFINIDEVLQLLGGGKHTGLLTLEKPDNRLDIYLHDGKVAFFDPYRFVRRVLPMADRLTYREITSKLLEEAEQRHVREGVPIFFTLIERGFFKMGELRELVKTLGAEVLYEFLRQDSALAFYYKRMDELPEFARKHDLRLGITPILLEGHKRFDEWRSLKKVFPDSEAPVKPLPDMFARISSLDLSVLEIKLLTMINGEHSPEQIAPMVGLPLQDVYHLLVKFAREGVLAPPGGVDSLQDLSLSMEESMEAAFEALDANDSGAVVESALDRVLGNNTEPAAKAREKALGSILDGADKRK